MSGEERTRYVACIHARLRHVHRIHPHDATAIVLDHNALIRAAFLSGKSIARTADELAAMAARKESA